MGRRRARGGYFWDGYPVVFVSPVSHLRRDCGRVGYLGIMAMRWPWVRTKRKRARRRRGAAGGALYLLHKEEARAKVHEKVAEWNRVYGFPVGRIAIRNSRTRWGSCSR